MTAMRSYAAALAFSLTALTQSTASGTIVFTKVVWEAFEPFRRRQMLIKQRSLKLK